MKDTQHYIEYSKKALEVEDLFKSFCDKNKYINCKSSEVHSYENVFQGIDFFVKVLYYGKPYEFTVDVKSRFHNDTGDTVSIAHTARNGKPGTIQTSQADYYAIRGTYKGQDRFYLIKSDILKDYCFNRLSPFRGKTGGSYYIVPMSWISKNWTFFVNENGYIVKSQFKKFN